MAEGSLDNAREDEEIRILKARGVVASIHQWDDSDLSGLIRDIERENRLSLEAAKEPKKFG